MRSRPAPAPGGQYEMTALLGSRLREAIAAANHTQRSLADASGVPVETINRIVTGESAAPLVSTLTRLTPFLNVGVGWLLGERTATASDDELRALAGALSVVRRRLAGGGADARRQGNAEPVCRPEDVGRRVAERFPDLLRVPTWREGVPAAVRGDASGPTYLFRVHGDALYGAGVADGDQAYVRPCDTDAALGEIVACQLNGVWHLRRLLVLRSGFTLSSENDAFAPIVVTRTDVFVVLGHAVAKVGAL